MQTYDEFFKDAHATPGTCGRVVAVNISERKGERKVPQASIDLEVGLGVSGDAHSGAWHRQVSLLGEESVNFMRAKGVALSAGDFAENILTQGIALNQLPVGTVLKVGPALLAVTQIGKKCHNECQIKRQVGMCVMPTDGIFTVVIKGGTVKPDDEVLIVSPELIKVGGLA